MRTLPMNICTRSGAYVEIGEEGIRFDERTHFSTEDLEDIMLGIAKFRYEPNAGPPTTSVPYEPHSVTLKGTKGVPRLCEECGNVFTTATPD